MSFPTRGFAPASLVLAICVSTMLIASAQADNATAPCATDDILPITVKDGAVSANWNTLSGLTADPTNATRLFAVGDNDSDPARIFEIEVKDGAAQIVREVPITGKGACCLDLEGVVAAADGSFWLVSEGNDTFRRNLLLKVAADGRIADYVPLPGEIEGRTKRKGLEGVALDESGDHPVVYVALQEPLDDDKKKHTRIGRYDTKSKTWSYALYPLQSKKAGVSELLHIGGKRFAAIERDNKSGDDARIKLVTDFELKKGDGELPVAKHKRTALDLVAFYARNGCPVDEQIEGLAKAADGTIYAVVDHDEVSMTPLLRLGRSQDLFPE